MNDVIAIGDEARLSDGTIGTVVAIEKFSGIYVLNVKGEIVVAHRRQFQAVKWLPSTVGATGLGVCAHGASGQ